MSSRDGVMEGPPQNLSTTVGRDDGTRRHRTVLQEEALQDADGRMGSFREGSFGDEGPGEGSDKIFGDISQETFPILSLHPLTKWVGAS